MVRVSLYFESLKVRTVLELSPCTATPLILMRYGSLSDLPIQVVTFTVEPAGAVLPVMAATYCASRVPLVFQQGVPSTLLSVGVLGFWIWPRRAAIPVWGSESLRGSKTPGASLHWPVMGSVIYCLLPMAISFT